MLYPQKTSIQFFMEWGKISHPFLLFTNRARPSGPAAAAGLKRALGIAQLLPHSHQFSTFLRGALSPAERSLPGGDKALRGLFFLTVEMAFLGRRVPPAPRALLPS